MSVVTYNTLCFSMVYSSEMQTERSRNIEGKLVCLITHTVVDKRINTIIDYLTDKPSHQSKQKYIQMQEAVFTYLILVLLHWPISSPINISGTRNTPVH